MPQNGKIECFISTADGPLMVIPILDDPEEVVSKAGCRSSWIVVKPGVVENFSINISALPGAEEQLQFQKLGANALEFYISLDGAKPELSCEPLGEIGVHGGYLEIKGQYHLIELRKLGEKKDYVYFSQYAFSSRVVNTKTRERHEDEDMTARIGSLEVRMVRVSLASEEQKLYPAAPDDGKRNGAQSTHKDDLKGREISMTSGLSRSDVQDPFKPNSTVTTIIDSKENPFMTFRFLYRTQGEFENLGVLEPEVTLNDDEDDAASISSSTNSDFKSYHQKKRDMSPASSTHSTSELSSGDETRASVAALGGKTDLENDESCWKRSIKSWLSQTGGDRQAKTWSYYSNLSDTGSYSSHTIGRSSGDSDDFDFRSSSDSSGTIRASLVIDDTDLDLQNYPVDADVDESDGSGNSSTSSRTIGRKRSRSRSEENGSGLSKKHRGSD